MIVKFKIVDVLEVEVDDDANDVDIENAISEELKDLASTPTFLENAETEIVEEEDVVEDELEEDKPEEDEEDTEV